MARKLDDEAAFAFYVGLAGERSYALVAKKFGVSHRAITKAAQRGNWAERLDQIDRDAQVRFDAKLTETRAEVRERHLKLVRAIASRGVQGLQAHQVDNARDAIKAIETAVKLERIIMGEPSERLGISIQEATRREVESFLAAEGEPPEADDY